MSKNKNNRVNYETKIFREFVETVYFAMKNVLKYDEK